MLLDETLKEITHSDKEAVMKAKQHIDNLAKPIGSLGKLEEIGAKFAGITGKTINKVNKKTVVVMCADNGVCDEGVSAAPQSITTLMTYCFPKMTTGVGVLAEFAGADLTIVDIGVKDEINHPKIISRKIMKGTKNMSIGPAMSREEAIKAIEAGIEIVDNLVKEGYDLIGTGEMGIGNTSSSAAVIASLLDLKVEDVVGMGAGLTLQQFQNKMEVIQRSLDINKPDKNDVIDVLSKVGGLDIAGMCGCFLGAAKNKVAIVIDGLISGAAALCAYKLKEEVLDYMFASHKSEEIAVESLFKEIKMTPMLDLNMRLGEGSGCPLAFNIIEAALYMTGHMASFNEVGIQEEESEKLVDIRDKSMI